MQLKLLPELLSGLKHTCTVHVHTAVVPQSFCTIQCEDQISILQSTLILCLTTRSHQTFNVAVTTGFGSLRYVYI